MTRYVDGISLRAVGFGLLLVTGVARLPIAAAAPSGLRTSRAA